MAEYITIMLINNKTAGMRHVHPLVNLMLTPHPPDQITAELQDREYLAYLPYVIITDVSTSHWDERIW